jgi:hypothetical protein
MKKISHVVFLIVMLIPMLVHAQKQEIEVPDYWETSKEGTLNDSVNAVIQRGTLSNTVFKLKSCGTYILTSSIVTPAGQTLEIIGDEPENTQQTALPMICWTPSISSSPSYWLYIFDVAGEIKMKNVWILWASLDGIRHTSTIRIGDSVSVSGGRCEFDNVIFDLVQQANSGAIQPFATHFKGYFKNCYWKNCTDNHFRYYGRAVSVPFSAQGIHIDTIAFENCTFANIGYVYMQENGVYGDNVLFNHCTFYNVMMFSLESGWWWKMHVTNSLFINTYMFGHIPAWLNENFGGTMYIEPMDSCHLGNGFGFKPDWSPKDGVADFTEQDRRILFAHNCYFIDPWLVDWMGYGPNGSPYSKSKHQYKMDDEIFVPQSMLTANTLKFFDSVDVGGKKVFSYMNKANLYNGLSITPTCTVTNGPEYTYPIVQALEEYNPRFVNPPMNQDSLKDFINHKWDDCSDQPWEWDPWNSFNQIWPLLEDLSYSNDTLKTAGMGGFPLGDLYRWWPDKYKQWKMQEKAENETINKWLHYGFNSTVGVNKQPGLPKEFVLEQNYPNPFNPTTTIKYSVPASPFSQKWDQGGFITLKVYNLLGQEVATLFEGVRDPGNYEIIFDGSTLASGVYLYRLTAGSNIQTKKLVSMK